MSALCVLAAKREAPVHSLTLLASLLDFSDPGDIGLFLDADAVAEYERRFGAGGLMPGRDMMHLFAALRSDDLIWPYVVGNYYRGEEPPAFDLLFWNSDSTNLPGPFFCEYVRRCYLENAIVKGESKMCGARVDPARLKLPVFAVACEKDHIVPWRGAYRSAATLGGSCDFVLAASGHIAGIVNPPQKKKGWHLQGGGARLPADSDKWRETAKRAEGGWWPTYFRWLAAKSGKKIAAPKSWRRFSPSAARGRARPLCALAARDRRRRTPARKCFPFRAWRMAGLRGGATRARRSRRGFRLSRRDRQGAKMKEIAILSACRTAIGKFDGALASLAAADLGALVLREAAARAKIEPDQIEDVLMGQVLAGGCGQNPARQAAMGAGIPKETPAMTINQVCGSGLRAVALAATAIRAGEATVVACGGQENMSAAPHVLNGSRRGFRLGDAKLVDSMVFDGLTDIFNRYHMGVTAENIAREKKHRARGARRFRLRIAKQNRRRRKKRASSPKRLFRFRFRAAKATPLFSTRTNSRVMARRSKRSAQLRPAFAKDGTVTPGNASGINDGAAALIVADADWAASRGLPVLARIKSFAWTGVDPAVMGMGPAPASRRCLQKANWQIGDLDLLEINEAFAAQALAVNREMGWDSARVNVNGGAIALGHPIGASGARILTTLLFEMRRAQARKGLASLCIGGGMGIALAVERD